MKEELSLLSLSAPLAPLKLVTLLQDGHGLVLKIAQAVTVQRTAGEQVNHPGFCFAILFSASVRGESDPQFCWPIPDV